MKGLHQLKPGEVGTIKHVKGTSSISQRLLEMGLTDGTLVMVVRTAPLGDPIEICLHGYHLSLRKAEASLIEIEA